MARTRLLNRKRSDPSDITADLKASEDLCTFFLVLKSKKPMDAAVALQAMVTFLGANGIDINLNKGYVEPS